MAEYIDREATLHHMKIDVKPPFYVVQNMPSSDVAPVRPELRKAVKVLHSQYEKAINNPVVRNPLAWALFHTWKQMAGE